MTETGPDVPPESLTRAADRVLGGLAWAVVLGCALVIWYGQVRPGAPHGERYGALIVAVGVALAGALGFLLLRRRLYRYVSPLALCLALLGVALPVLAFETAANLLDLRGFLYYADSERYFHWQSWDATVLSHAHPKGAELPLRWGTIRTNREGWRSPEIPEARPPGRFRLLGLGDSVMFSWGTDEPDTLRAALERALLARRDALGHAEDVEVINTGNCSFGSVDELLVLKTRGLAYEPSAVLVLAIENDFVDRPALEDQVAWLEEAGALSPELVPTLAATARPRSDWSRARTGLGGAVFYRVAYALKRSFLATSLGNLVRSLRGRSQARPPKSAAEVSEADLRRRYRYLAEQTAALREIGLVLRARGTPLLVSVYDAPGLAAHLGGALAGLATVRALRLPEGLDPMRYRNSATDAHWNPAGNEVYAELLAAQVVEAVAAP